MAVSTRSNVPACSLARSGSTEREDLASRVQSAVRRIKCKPSVLAIPRFRRPSGGPKVYSVVRRNVLRPSILSELFGHASSPSSLLMSRIFLLHRATATSLRMASRSYDIHADCTITFTDAAPDELEGRGLHAVRQNGRRGEQTRKEQILKEVVVGSPLETSSKILLSGLKFRLIRPPSRQGACRKNSPLAVSQVKKAKAWLGRADVGIRGDLFSVRKAKTATCYHLKGI